MKFRLVVRPEVDADLLEAEKWYERQQAGLGRNFLRTVRKKLAELPRNPFLYRVRQQRRQVRWATPISLPHRRARKAAKTNRLEMLLSYSGFPMLVLPRSMQNCIDDDFILNHSENDSGVINMTLRWRF